MFLRYWTIIEVVSDFLFAKYAILSDTLFFFFLECNKTEKHFLVGQGDLRMKENF